MQHTGPRGAMFRRRLMKWPFIDGRIGGKSYKIPSNEKDGLRVCAATVVAGRNGKVVHLLWRLQNNTHTSAHTFAASSHKGPDPRLAPCSLRGVDAASPHAHWHHGRKYATVRPISTSPAWEMSDTIPLQGQHQALDTAGLKHSVRYKQRQLGKC